MRPDAEKSTTIPQLAASTPINYTHKSTLRFTIIFHPQALNFTNAVETVCPLIFKKIRQGLNGHCLIFQVDYLRNFSGGVVGLKFSCELLTHLLEEDKVKQICLETILPGSSFSEKDFSMLCSAAIADEDIWVNDKMLKLTQGWDSGARQISSIFDFRASTNLTETGRNSTHYKYNAFGEIIEIKFEYASPKMAICKLIAPKKEKLVEIVPKKEDLLTSASSEFFSSNPPTSPKIWRKHPRSEQTRYVLFKPESISSATELKDALCKQGLHAYLSKGSETEKTAVYVNLSK